MQVLSWKDSCMAGSRVWRHFCWSVSGYFYSFRYNSLLALVTYVYRSNSSSWPAEVVGMEYCPSLESWILIET